METNKYKIYIIEQLLNETWFKVDAVKFLKNTVIFGIEELVYAFQQCKADLGIMATYDEKVAKTVLQHLYLKDITGEKYRIVEKAVTETVSPMMLVGDMSHNGQKLMHKCVVETKCNYCGFVCVAKGTTSREEFEQEYEKGVRFCDKLVETMGGAVDVQKDNNIFGED